MKIKDKIVFVFTAYTKIFKDLEEIKEEIKKK